ncbi:MAG: nicotinate phosphoribosyltransferase [Sphingomonadales bacterium]|nr:nicotinate phosphoribosyltransferase [Sphingomonadales bacterium]
MDFAKRAFDHSYHIDPIVRSLLDTDFYKLLMHQFIYQKHPNEQVGFALKNRTRSVRLAEEIDIGELREQLDSVRALRFRPSEIVWLRGQSFYGQYGLFEESYLHHLKTLHLPEYELGTTDDGQIRLEFHGLWMHTTLWEIYALEIINELRYRRIMRGMNRSQLDIMYARAKVKLYDKLERLREVEGLEITDFGTRRRHSHLWQEHCILTAKEVLGDDVFTGTSNAYFAAKHDLEAKGTNAHELPMVLAALADGEEALKEAQYKVLKQWQNVYRGGLLVMLPDTFGTTQFLRNAPEWVRHWTGARPDSKRPIAGGEEMIAFWRERGEDPNQKLLIFSDGMDVALPGQPPNGSDIPEVLAHFRGRVRLGFGWGTNLTNDFIGCHPEDPDRMRPISVVVKVKDANGRPAVKLSDNYEKATGPADEVARYRKVFGTEGVADVPVTV